MIAMMLAFAAPEEPVVVAYAECLVGQARALDDGVSDATSVARIVREQCRGQERAAALALSGDGAYDNRGVVVYQIERGGLDRAIRAVLRVRAQR